MEAGGNILSSHYFRNYNKTICRKYRNEGMSLWRDFTLLYLTFWVMVAFARSIKPFLSALHHTVFNFFKTLSSQLQQK